MSQHRKSILLLGAGKSASYLIKYLANWCEQNKVDFVIADMFISALDRLPSLTSKSYNAVLLNDKDSNVLESLISSTGIVISMLPVTSHYNVALLCIKHAKDLLTASYITPELKLLAKDVETKGVTFLFECGLDPGIDHMSAFSLIDKINEKAERITSFISSTGGLVDPLYEGDNPWRYKFTWNPRNVVLAGKGTAVFKENGTQFEIAYAKLFSSARQLSWSGKEALEFYPNRDSLSYQSLYCLKDVDTFIRGTIRRKGYCSAWNVLVLLGMTDDDKKLPVCDTYRAYLECFVSHERFTKGLVEEKIGIKISDEVWLKIQFLELDSDTLFIGIYDSAAQYLQAILEVKWALKDADKDWVLMQHRISSVDKHNVTKEYVSTLSVKGENKNFTAMSKTVGLPLAMAAILVYEKQWQCSGINIPSDPKLYNLLLPELAKEGIIFEEEEF